MKYPVCLNNIMFGLSTKFFQFPGNINVGKVHLHVDILRLVYTSDTLIHRISFCVLRIAMLTGVSSTKLMVTRRAIKLEVFSFVRQICEKVNITWEWVYTPRNF